MSEYDEILKRIEASGVIVHNVSDVADAQAGSDERVTAAAHVITGLQRDRTRLTNALIDAVEFIQRYADVRDGGEGKQLPNEAMSLAQDIEDVLKSVGVRDE